MAGALVSPARLIAMTSPAFVTMTTGLMKRHSRPSILALPVGVQAIRAQTPFSRVASSASQPAAGASDRLRRSSA